MSRFGSSVRRRDLAWSIALVLLLSATWVVRSDDADAGLVAPPGEGIAVVYVAVGTNFPDSLGVGPGGGVNGAPIIILPKDPPIPTASSNELVRLDPRTLIIAGGTGVISAAMETALGILLPNAAISRIAGADRYETNAMFSAATFPIEGWASIPAAAFTADDPATDVAGITAIAYNLTSPYALYAPIQLPHGAEILELKASVYDDNALDIQVSLIRVANDFDQIPAFTVGTTAFSGGLATLSDTIITVWSGLDIVDNENYAYMIQVVGASGTPSMINAMVRYRIGVSTG